MKTGLVLEGGAMRGLFTCGVLDVLMENHVDFDGMIGVSAGAAFGCNFKSRQAGRAIRYNKRYCRDPRYCGVRSLLKTGDLYGGEFCYHTIPEKLDLFDGGEFARNPMEFYAVVTDVATGKACYHLCGKDAPVEFEWIRASASMPLFSRPVELEGKRYLDGGISDSIPLGFFESIGYKKNLVVLTQPAHFCKKKPALLPLFWGFFRKYPAIYNAMKTRYLNYNASLALVAEREKSGDALVIRPPAPLPSGKVEHNAGRMQLTYDIGRAAAQSMIDKINHFLEK